LSQPGCRLRADGGRPVEPSLRFKFAEFSCHGRQLSNPGVHHNEETLASLPWRFSPATWRPGPASATQSSATDHDASRRGALPISDYYNQNVYDSRDNKIGEINDLLVDNGGKGERGDRRRRRLSRRRREERCRRLPSLKVAERTASAVWFSTPPRKRWRRRLAVPADRRALGCRETGLIASPQTCHRPERSCPFRLRPRNEMQHGSVSNFRPRGAVLSLELLLRKGRGVNVHETLDRRHGSADRSGERRDIVKYRISTDLCPAHRQSLPFQSTGNADRAP
jgi:hypothetical protein